MNITPRLMAYLKSWFASSTASKAADGVIVELTFEQFLTLFEKRQISSLEKAIIRNRLRDQQNEKSQYAYVLSWKSYAARSTNVYSLETAIVCSRIKSAKLALPQPGDKLRPGHCGAIAEALTGKPKSQEHAESISKGKKGRSIAAWSPERRMARSELRRAQEAMKRDARASARSGAPLEQMPSFPERLKPALLVASHLQMAVAGQETPHVAVLLVPIFMEERTFVRPACWTHRRSHLASVGPNVMDPAPYCASNMRLASKYDCACT